MAKSKWFLISIFIVSYVKLFMVVVLHIRFKVDWEVIINKLITCIQGLSR